MGQRRGRLWIGMSLVLLVLVLAFSGPVSAGGMRYRVSLSYVDGVEDIADLYEDNWEQEQLDAGAFFADADIVTIPIGLAISPFYQWDSGLTFGGGVGPIFAIWGDIDHIHVPLNLTVGYVFFEDSPVAIHVRGGLSYHVADGDYVDDSSLGFLAGVGVELIRSDHFAFGLEATYDSAEIDIENLVEDRIEGIKAAEFSAGVFFQFK